MKARERKERQKVVGLTDGGAEGRSGSHLKGWVPTRHRYRYTAPGRVYIGCPEQVLMLAGSGDHGYYENILKKKIFLFLWKLHSKGLHDCMILHF